MLMTGLLSGSIISHTCRGCSYLLVRSIFSNSVMSSVWYAVTRFVMATISGLLRYGLAYKENNKCL